MLGLPSEGLRVEPQPGSQQAHRCPGKDILEGQISIFYT